jgi:hypothetical protein
MPILGWLFTSLDFWCCPNAMPFPYMIMAAGIELRIERTGKNNQKGGRNEKREMERREEDA